MEDKEISDTLQRSIVLALVGFPTVVQTEKAISKLQIVEAPGVQGISPEIYKLGGIGPRRTSFRPLIHSIWEKGELVQDLKDANTTHLYNKVLIAGKVLA